MGRYRPYSSFSDYAGDPLICLTLSSLIIVGGIGFLVWDNVLRHGIHFRRYELHAKLALTTSALLIVGGFGILLLTEAGGVNAGRSMGETLLVSFFGSVSPRTAGFFTVDPAGLSDSGVILTSLLMFIGGSPGSTAGGIKTTTLAVLLLSTLAEATGRNGVSVFGRRLDDDAVRRTGAVVAVYATASLLACGIICAAEPATVELREVIFEVSSAIGTVGLSMGITPVLSVISKIVLILLMFAGRVGGLSLVLMLGEQRRIVRAELPTENILIG